MREVRWERMFRHELEAAIEACPLVYFTYGLCEPHGPHNAVGLDSLKAHAIACRAAREGGGIVAPPDYWHVHEVAGYGAWGHASVGDVARTWLTAVPPWVHFRNVCYHIRAAEMQGFHAAILMTGHYGPNWRDLKLLVERIQPEVAARLYALPDFEANESGFDRDGDSGGDHAGRVETSLLWALEPECVDVSRLPGADSPGPHFAMGPDARQANRGTGERMAADEVRWLVAKGRELLADWQPAGRGLSSFADVERFWREQMEPYIDDLASMQLHPTRPDVPESSSWHANWRVRGVPGS